jgi:uncharacterized Zn finger protein
MRWDDYAPYVSVAQRRAGALREVQKLARKGRQLSPVKVAGRAIASTFWGKAWCDNLESYSDFSNRLPRGRTYVRNGSVVDLRVEAGEVTALVSGSRLYRITIGIHPLAAPRWDEIKTQCGGQIGSLVELLQGRLSHSVMQIVTCHGKGLFPSPKEIQMSCSCPDWADMCKHVAATLYGIGNRLDREPELLFKLRAVDHLELIAQAGSPVARPAAGRKTIAADRLADVFGIDLETEPTPAARVVQHEQAVPVQAKQARRGSKKKRKPPAPRKETARAMSAQASRAKPRLRNGDETPTIR